MGNKFDYHRADGRNEGENSIIFLPVLFDEQLNGHIEHFIGIGLVMYVTESHPLESKKDVVGQYPFVKLGK